MALRDGPTSVRESVPTTPAGCLYPLLSVERKFIDRPRALNEARSVRPQDGPLRRSHGVRSDGAVLARQIGRVARMHSAVASLRASELADLCALFERVRSSGRGVVIFVSGSEGSGRTWVLKRLDEALRSHDAKPVVLAGSMASGEYRPWDQPRQGTRRGANDRRKRPDAGSAPDRTDRPPSRPDRRAEQGGP
jgi:hypothetical protein